VLGTANDVVAVRPRQPVRRQQLVGRVPGRSEVVAPFEMPDLEAEWEAVIECPVFEDLDGAVGGAGVE
jgi:hypothetical protein